MRTFRVYFADGNVKLYEGENIVSVINFVVYVDNFLANQIMRVEEVKND